MALSIGTRLGAYEVLGSLGAGGMGEVYRARDPRLGREVAVKVLPADLSADAGRLSRFEKEARSASALNHPNIVTIHEIGSVDSTSFIVMELVEGKTLRELLFAGALPIKKILQISTQMADGLARAHEAGIVHRDLKPENVMVTKEGLVKILDFGLAKLTKAVSGSDEGSHLPTETGTSPGTLLGTVGYMSPEQASGQSADFRSDQFSFGSILYEMTTGKRAFQKKTGVDTLSAIINHEAEPIASFNPGAPTPLRWIVERCLSKEPADRYASTQDLARDLVTVRDRLSEAGSGDALAVARPRSRTWLLVAVALLLASSVALLAGLRLGKTPSIQPQFQRLTFGRGFVDTARFSPDGQTIIYSAVWDGNPPHIFLTRPESPESQRLDLPDASLLSISPRGELAIVTGKPQIGYGWWFSGGTLATVPLTGGAPREVAEDVRFADWAPDGKNMLVVKGNQLEFPAGKVIRRGSVVLPRISPAGDKLAFVEGGAGLAWRANRVYVTDLSGKELVTSQRSDTVGSLAWHPSAGEVWFTTGRSGVGTLRALSISGEERVLMRMPRGLTLEDVSREGKILLGVHNRRQELRALPAGETLERDLTVLGTANGMGLSSDGKTVLDNETSPAGDVFYLCRADGSPPKKLGEGFASELSPDGKWAVVARPGPPTQLVLVPTGAGEEKLLDRGGIEEHDPLNVRWSQDGRRLLFGAHEKGKEGRLWIQDIGGGGPRPLTPDGVHVEDSSISPDGRFVIAFIEGGYWIYPTDGGERRRTPFQMQTEFIWRNWSDDGRFVYTWSPEYLPFRVSRIEVATGRREPWKTIAPQDPAGIWSADLMLTPDGKSYAYSCARDLSDLFLVTGLR